MNRSLRDKTRFYQSLYTGYHSGLPADMLVSITMAQEGMLDERLKAEISRGMSLTSALLARKLISRWEAGILRVGEESGRMEAVLLDLQTYYQNRSQQYREIRSRLLYPVILLLFAIFVPPLPLLFSGSSGILDYVLSTGGKTLVFFLGYYFFFIVPFEKSVNGAFNPLLLKLVDVVATHSKLRKIFEVSYLNLLQICLESGMDAGQTLRLLQGCSERKTYQQNHQRAIRCVEQHGDSLSHSLSSTGIIRHPEIISFIQSSEKSGTLHSELRTYVARKKAELQIEINYLVQRICKWFYLLVLLYVAARII